MIIIQEEYLKKSDFADFASAWFSTWVAWVTATNYSAGEVRYNTWGSPTTYGLFKCRAAHASAAGTEPGVGANWATVWDFIAGGGSAGPTGAAGATGAAGPAHVCQGRLTLTTGVPVTTADVTSATTLYFTPYMGAYIGLYYDSAWDAYEFNETSLSLAGLEKNVTYDVFGYYDDGASALALELAAWKKVTASNSPTSGSDKTISMADTSGVTAGDWVTVLDASNSEVCHVKTVNTNTSIVITTLANGYTTPDVYFPKTRATEIVLTSGVMCKSGDTTRRYLGTLRTDASGDAEDSDSKRFLWNFYNRSRRRLFHAINENSTYNTATWRPYNNSTAHRTSAVIGYVDDVVYMHAHCRTWTEAYYFVLGIGLDQIAGTNSQISVNASAGDHSIAVYEGYPTAGYVFLQLMEYATGSKQALKSEDPQFAAMLGYVIG